MSAQDSLRAGDVRGAIEAVQAELRNRPSDGHLRTFLFELFCFAGDFDRASRQLGILSQEGADAQTGALVYRSALAAAQQREHDFSSGAFPAPIESVRRPGTLNGTHFESIEDCDPRIGSRLEVFVAGECVWVSFAHISALRMEQPRFLRDTLWPTVRVTAGPELRGQEFGEVIMPVLYPSTSKHPDGSVKLGRGTVWDDAGIPAGQKLLLLDGEHVIPYLEIRELQFLDANASQEAEANSQATPSV